MAIKPITTIFSLIFTLQATLAQPSACGSGWTYVYDFGCYYFGDTEMSWEEAVDFCHNRIGVLAEMKTMAEDSILHDPLYVQPGDSFWLGMSDAAQEGVYVWNSTNEVLSTSFSSWAGAEPTGTTAENCIAATESKIHFWSDEDCSQKYKPLCFGGDPVLKCPNMFEYIPELGHCYHHGETAFEDLHFEDAVKRCRDLRGYLVEIDTEYEQEVLTRWLDVAHYGWVYWVGHTDALEEGVWRGVTSHKVMNYSNFDNPTGQPDQEDCVEMFDEDFENWYWVDVDCNIGNNQVICEAEPLY